VLTVYLATVYGSAMVIGAVPAYFWAKRNPKNFDIYGFAVAGGLIAGEGIGGVINAVFQIAGIAGPDPYGKLIPHELQSKNIANKPLGTNIACPGDAC